MAERQRWMRRNARERERTGQLKAAYLELRAELGDANLEKKTNKLRTLNTALQFITTYEGELTQTAQVHVASSSA